MARKASATTPVIAGGTLYTDDEASGAAVGSQAFYTWLLGATSFYYDGEGGSFTARREKRQRGDAGGYWYAYREIRGKLRSAYLGKSENLTGERLRQVAQKLAEHAEAAL
jgi:hypothetical protein